MNLSVVLLAVVFSFKAVSARTTAPLIPTIEQLFHGRREVYRVVTFQVVSAGADVAAVGVHTGILGWRRRGCITEEEVSGCEGC